MNGRPAQREMLAAADQSQNTSAQIHGVAYQNKTSSFAICQGWKRSGPHFETQKTATAVSARTTDKSRTHTQNIQMHTQSCLKETTCFSSPH